MRTQNAKHKTVYLLLFLLLGFRGTGQEKEQLLSFSEALQIVFEQNPALLRQKEEIHQKEYEVKSKKGLRFPSVSISASAVSMSDPLHLDLTPVGEAISPLYETLGNYGVFSGVPNPDPASNKIMPTLPDEISTAAVRNQLLEAADKIESSNWDQIIQEKNFALLAANFTLPVYAGGKINAANKAAAIHLEISKEKLRNTQGTLLTELVTRYYGLALANQVVQLRTEMLKSISNHYNDAKKLFDNGMIAKVELLHSEVAKNEAERELKKAKRNVEILQTALRATLASDSLSNPVPASKLFVTENVQSLQSCITKAKELNPQVKQIQSKKELIDIKHQLEKNEYLPTIAALGNYNLADKNFSPYMPDWMVGVGMKWTLFKGMSRKNNIQASHTIQNQVVYAEEKANNDLRTFLVKLFNQLEMQIEQKAELEKTLELATEYCLSTEKAFNEGLATSTTVVDARTQLLQVKTKRLLVYYNFDVTLAQFLQNAGIPEQFTNYSESENMLSTAL